MEIKLDRDTHTYFVDGVRKLGVTRILNGAGAMDTRYFTEEARQRGAAVHQACALIDDGLEDEMVILPSIAPFLEAYRAFLRFVHPEWWYVELPVADPLMGYAGTLDRAGLVHGQRAIVDIKTGDEVPPWVGLQTAAYRRCLPEPHTWARYALQLTAAGLWSLQPLEDPKDEKVFLAALIVQQWRQTNGIGVAA